MSEDKKLREIIIYGKGTAEELEARKKAIESGEELLPDGTRFPDHPDNEFVLVKIIWEEFERRREAFLDFYASPKQLLDLKLRPVREKDLSLPSPPGANRKEMLAAIRGGLNSIDLNLLESSLLHMIVEAFSRADYPEKITLNRAGLYEAMGVEKVRTPAGQLRWPEGRNFWTLRSKYDNALMGLSRKSWPFIFRQIDGQDKKGEPTYRVILAYESIIKVKDVYEKVRQSELPGFEGDEKIKEERFSHYEIRLNPAAIGEVNHYFRYLPSGLAREISDSRKSRGQRASVYEFNFVEYLYTVGREVIEINFLKLAEKLKIKIKSFRGPAEIERRTRQILRRCYETALTLRFALEILENQPAARGRTKEVIRLNPERFKYLSQGRLFRREDVGDDT